MINNFNHKKCSQRAENGEGAHNNSNGVAESPGINPGPPALVRESRSRSRSRRPRSRSPTPPRRSRERRRRTRSPSSSSDSSSSSSDGSGDRQLLRSTLKSLRRSAEAHRDTTANLLVVADKFSLIGPQLESALEVSTRALQTATSFLEAGQGAIRRQGVPSADGAPTSRNQGPPSSTPLRERESASSSHRQREAASSFRQQGAGTSRNYTEVFDIPLYSSTLSSTPRVSGVHGSRVFVNPQGNLSQYELSLGGNSIQNQGFPKVDIKRNYTLTKATFFDLWFDRLVSELTTAGLL